MDTNINQPLKTYFLSHYFRVLLLLSCQIVVKGFITRLPCIMYAKLNLIESRYNSGTVVKQLTSLTQNQCALSCVTDTLCVLANFKKDGTSCELISSVDASETNSNEWNSLKSDTSSDKLVCCFYQFIVLMFDTIKINQTN